MTLLGCEFQEGMNTTASRKNHAQKYAPFKLYSILLLEWQRYGLVFVVLYGSIGWFFCETSYVG